MTKAQIALAVAAALVIPPLLRLKFEGGVVGQGTELGFEDVLIATWPWAMSVAGATWFVMTNRNSSGDGAAGAALCIIAGAVLAYLLVPQFELTADQAGQAQYYLLGKVDSGLVSHAGQIAAHSGRAGVFLVVFGIVISIVGIYGVLYGFALWAAGLAAGIYAGKMIYEAFPGQVAEA